MSEETFEQPPLIVAVLTYFGYAILVLFGYFRDFLRATGIEKNKNAQELPKQKVRRFAFVVR